jgi:MSHA biogenesis protein MshQ
VTVELVDGAGASACASRGTLSPAQSQVLVFAKTGQPTDLGRKSVSFTVANAYQDLRCRVTDGNQVPALVACSGDNFAVRPSAVTLSTSASAAPPPAANAASGAPTVKAGLGFSLQASTSTGTNYAGTLALDTTKLSAQTTAQASTVQGGGAVGTLTPSTLATNPAVQPSANATYSEVGYLYLAVGAFYDSASPAFTAVDSSGDCIAGSFSDAFTAGKLGCNIGNANALSLGRFVPDHFDTAIVQNTAPVPCPAAPFACPANGGGGASGLLYANQPVSIKVTAKNAIGAGATTANYQGVFAKSASLSAWSAAGSAGVANPGGGSLANTTVAANVFVEGVGSALPTYALGTLDTAPADLYFRAVDTDNVTSLRASAVEAGLKVANGRIYLLNAHGSERLPLPIKAMVQYYNGTAWVNSLTDGASAFDSNLSTAGGNVVVSVLSGLGTGVTIANPATSAVAGGVRSFNLAAPLAAGSANISLNAPLYLPSTTSRATLGIFRSPLVYRRENY